MGETGGVVRAKRALTAPREGIRTMDRGRGETGFPADIVDNVWLGR